MPAKKTPKKKPQKRPVRRKPYDHNHIIRFLLISCGIVTFGIGFGLAWFFSLDIPNIQSVDDYRPQVATTILDSRGTMIDTICEQNRIVLRYKDINPLVPMAFVSAEDGRYWDHIGLDLWSIFRAFINNIRSGRRSQGGSTITQQVTRALMLSREKTYFRKIQEAILAYRLDKMLTKEDILSIYLNEIYLGEGAYGVEAASRTYFGKKSSQLNLAEAALLAGLPQSPSRYSPIDHFDKAQNRQRYVLNRMAEEGYITADEARTAFETKLQFSNPKKLKHRYGYFTEYIRQELEQKFDRDKIFLQGLVVSTTVDDRLQELAVRTVKESSERNNPKKNKPAPQTALVTITPASGRILAMVGGNDYRTSPFNRAAAAKRQPGSVFKPLIYATAFEKGLSANLVIKDTPMSIRNPDGSTWSPQNWSRKHYGRTSLRDGLIHSRNIVAIKLLQQIGAKPVISLAKKAGIYSPLQPDLTLALGSSPVSLLEMTGAYSMFANNGKFIQPHAITKIRDRQGNKLSWPQPQTRQVIRTKTAKQVTSLLEDVIAKGTGKLAQGIQNSAGKTGTTNNNRDGWFIGYTPQLLTGVWVGHDQNESLGKGATGGKTAAPIWLDFMKSASKFSH